MIVKTVVYTFFSTTSILYFYMFHIKFNQRFIYLILSETSLAPIVVSFFIDYQSWRFII